ncbi:NB-ARC domain, LRR domain containing protein [Trema orientale]|uniref:NB-ARC domain, LRR domain containing protein n=1 Tax=Trema orientale TaxID=63057 RepID=A0A2P5A3V9_TREOI|nr:NB-ARC domain, LRR domain containing protein [Trema orientale]
MAEFLVSKLAEAVVSQAVQRISDLLLYEAPSLATVKIDRLETWLVRLRTPLRPISSKFAPPTEKLFTSESFAIKSAPSKKSSEAFVNGGRGKTTLAKRVYNDVDVKKHFDCCAWIFISQQYGIRDLLSEIIIQVGSQFRRKGKIDRKEILEKWKKTDRRELLEKLIQDERERLKVAKDHELIDRLKRELQEERYLVVLDDIWSIDAWNTMRNAFPKGKIGSKIVFTTRNKEVAVIADPYSPPIEPPFLTDRESWELLHQKAFPKSIFPQHDCPQGLENIGKEMVQKCGGLPLAIVTLGGLLRTKNSLDGWKRVQRNVNSHLVKSKAQQKYGVEEILALSYHDLPYNLKPCFLYLGSFSEYWEIPKGKLIRLWIAEGFIQTERSEVEETLEEVAERYLEELIDRCVVQVGRSDHNGTGVKVCRMHDLMRDFCVSKAKEDNFFEIIEQPEMNMTTSIFSRRIAVHLGSHFGTQQFHSQLRSVLWSDVYNCPNTSLLRNKKFRLLRVLELGSARHKRPLRKMPIELGNLVHLRYLGLRNAEISELPHSIGNLQSLHTLDLRMKMLAYSLPESVSRLIRLRHLFLPDFRHTTDLSWSRCRFGMENLTNIQTLKHIRAESLIKYGMVLKLTNLQSLVIQFKSIPEARLVIKSPTFRVGRLRSLEMYMQNENAFPSLEPLSHCHLLSKLCLAGKIRSGGSSDHCLRFLPGSLTKLILRYSEIKQEGIEVMEKLLHNLRFLLLGYDSYSESEMFFSANGFPKLETLQLFGLFQLDNWQMEEGSMPSLKRLDVEYIPKLRVFPHGLMYVTTLQELNVVRMNRFKDRLQVIDGNEGADYYKVRHIPSVSFLNISV